MNRVRRGPSFGHRKAGVLCTGHHRHRRVIRSIKLVLIWPLDNHAAYLTLIALPSGRVAARHARKVWTTAGPGA